MGHDAEQDASATATAGRRGPVTVAGRRPEYVWGLAALSALVVLVSNASGIATGDDGVGYRAMADSLIAGDGYGYFLEDPVTVWPPVWPALMALVSWVTPLSTLGAAIALNAATAAGVVVAGNRLLRTVVDRDLLVLAGTVVLAVGPATVGLGHVLMTDLAFALVVTVWMLALARFRRTGATADLLGAAALCWLAFGVRYVGLVLIAFGGLWLLADSRRTLWPKVRDGVVYGVVATLVPLAWMLRNRSIDGTFTGERHPSARGLTENAFDILATVGRFLLPGVGNELTRVWAVVGVVGIAAAVLLAWQLLGRSGDDPGDRLGARARLERIVVRLGAPLGLVAGFAVLYLGYMLYVRTTTALNQLDLRLLFPAYIPLLVSGLALVDRATRAGDDRQRPAWRRDRVLVRGVVLWAALNVVAGLVGMTAFALGHPYFPGNYEADEFVEVRRSPALDAVPDDCELYSNLPNGLYPALESRWSPQQRPLESSREIPDLEEVTATLADTPSCLVWVDLPPRYAHLWPLDELGRHGLRLEPIAFDPPVSVYRMLPPG